MDFLTNLYSNDNFGIILFIVISILVLAFLIVLFFGKKDQKERKLAETKSIEVNNTLAQKAFTDDEPTVQLNIDPEVFTRPVSPVIEKSLNDEPLKEEINKIDKAPIIEENYTTINNNQEIDKESSSKIEEPLLPPKMDFDFDALADSISKELESISSKEESNLQEPLKVSEEMAKPASILNPISNKEISPLEEEVLSPKKEEPSGIGENEYTKPKMPSPNQFSSVFVSKKKETETKVDDLIQKPVIEEKEKPIVPTITPTKPKIELPKTIDLPKLNSNREENKNTNIVFSSLENDIPSYNKNTENRM
jgi:hypothetical protein